MSTGPDRRRAMQRMAAALAGAGTGGCAGLSPLPDLRTLIGRVAPSTAGVGDARGIGGSGFAVADGTLVATAAHVVKALQGPLVVQAAGTRAEARLVRLHEDTDLALLRLQRGLPLPALPLARMQPAVGQWIVVLGCPFGAAPTATVGIVSALPGAVLEPPELARRLQLNAAVNPGNSGGPVVDLEGQVIGVANATVPGGSGLGFAVPAADLQALLDLSRTVPGS